MKLRRVLAWIADWILCGIPAIVYTRVLIAITETQGVQVVYALIFVLFVLSFPVLFVARDALFNGRSIAKRAFKIRVIDNETKELPKMQKLIIRNLFFFIYPVEAVVLIVTNKSIGDMVTNTTVIND